MSETNQAKYLVSFDTDQIKSYVFATNSLREIRGASALLLEIDETRAKDLNVPDIAVAFSAGGSGAFEAADAEQAEKLAAQIEREFQSKTVSGSITAVVVPPKVDGKLLTFQQQMKLAKERMVQAKAAKAALFQVPLEPYMRPCDSCGMLPAEVRFTKDGMPELLCNACATKRKKGLKMRQDLETGYVGKFRKYVKNHHPDIANTWVEAKLAEDLTYLADLDGSGYIGYIVMDGNNMGELLEKIERKEDYKAYSNTLKQTVEHLVYEAIIANGKPINNVLPFEIVLIGGDDVILFTTAKLAMPVVLSILKGFEESTDAILDAGNIPHEKRPQKLTMSAGVVYAHGNFPVPALVEIGEGLMKSAKSYADKYAREKEGAVSAVDFMLITGSMFDLDTAKELSRAMRPFTLADMEKLIDYAAKVDLPAAQLHRAYEACVSGRLVDGTMATLQMMGRLRDARQREKVKEVLTVFSMLPKGKETIYWPWTYLDGPEDRKSVLVDLIELHRFANKESANG